MMRTIAASVNALAESGETLSLANGDVLRLTLSFGYKGPKQTVTLSASVGVKTGALISEFDEALTAEAEVACPYSPTTQTVTGIVDIPIVVDSSAVSAPFIGYEGKLPPGTGYDLLARIKEHPEVNVELDDVITLTNGAGGIMDIFPMIMMVMMLGMVMPMLGGDNEAF
jgi:hypothetical protein